MTDHFDSVLPIGRSKDHTQPTAKSKVREVDQGADRISDKLLGLELIRFVSALAVLVWHYQHFCYVAALPINLTRERQPFYIFLRLFYDYGYYGVQVFWCISGFIFFWKYRSKVSDKLIGPKLFFFLRFSRLYPLHLVTLVLVIALQSIYYFIRGNFFVYQDNDISHFVLQLFLASNWGSDNGYSFNGPIWSISVEVLVYIIFFLTLRFLGKSCLVNIFILILCLIAKLLKISAPVIDCLAFFYAGGLSVIIFQYFDSKLYRRIIGKYCLLYILLWPAIAYSAKLYVYKAFPSLFLLSFVPILLSVCAGRLNVPRRIKQVIEAVGNMTYSSYLIHFPIQLLIVIGYATAGRAIPFYDAWLLVGFLASTLIAAYCIYRWFEMPIQMFIRNKAK